MAWVMLRREKKSKMEECTNDKPHPALLDLRGEFHLASGLSVPNENWPPDYPMAVFPVTDEQAILVRAQKTLLINLPSGEVYWTITCPALEAALDMERNLLALGAKGWVYLWDLRSGSLIQSFSLGDDDDIATCLAFHPQGMFLAVGLYYDTIQLWRLADGQLVQRLSPEEWSCYKSLAFSPDGQFLASGNFEAGEVWLWQIPDGQLVQEMEPAAGRVQGLAFSPDGRLLVCGEMGGSPKDQEMRAWDMQTKKAVKSFARKDWCPAFSPDGKLLAAGDLNFISIWDVATRKSIRFIPTHQSFNPGIVFSPSGQILVSIDSQKRTFCWWNVENGQEIYRLS